MVSLILTFVITNSMKIVLFIVLRFLVNERQDGEAPCRYQYEDLEKGPLKLCNKPGNESLRINEEEDRVIDLIDFENQPAFDHALHKNHMILMEPSLLPENVLERKFPMLGSTVTIAGAPQQGSINVKIMSNPCYENHVFDVVKISEDACVSSRRANAWIIAKNLSVSADQVSELGAMWMQMGDKDQLSSTKIGCRVYALFCAAEGSHRAGCCNYLCPCFVQVRMLLWGDGQNLRLQQQPKYHLTGLVFKDLTMGHWSLTLDELG